MATSPLLLDREFLKTLEQVTLLCRTNLSGAVGPEHRSRTRGPGMEFADYRRYSLGDDPRSLDWSAYLRFGKLFLKIYETEQHIPVRILMDCSESMEFGDGGESKFLYAQRLAATFAYLGVAASGYNGRNSIRGSPKKAAGRFRWARPLMARAAISQRTEMRGDDGRIYIRERISGQFSSRGNCYSGFRFF